MLGDVQMSCCIRVQIVRVKVGKVARLNIEADWKREKEILMFRGSATWTPSVLLRSANSAEQNAR